MSNYLNNELYVLEGGTPGVYMGIACVSLLVSIGGFIYRFLIDKEKTDPITGDVTKPNNIIFYGAIAFAVLFGIFMILYLMANKKHSSDAMTDSYN